MGRPISDVLLLLSHPVFDGDAAGARCNRARTAQSTGTQSGAWPQTAGFGRVPV